MSWSRMFRLPALLAALVTAEVVAQGPLLPPPQPIENPVTAAKAVLGKILFFEEQLSSNGRMACGTCHRAATGGGDPRRERHPGPDGLWNTVDDRYASPGVERREADGAFYDDPLFHCAPRVTGRAAPSNLQAAWFDNLFWDGRANPTFVDPVSGAPVIAAGGALESQALHPLLDEIEMSRAGRWWPELVTRLAAVQPLALAATLPADVAQALAASPTYQDLFRSAFGDPTITPARLAMAIAAYERSAVPDRTPWDDYQRGNLTALTPSQTAGWNLFQSQARCVLCHLPPLFSDRQFRAAGLVPIADDPGRGAVTGLAQDAGRFKVPSLRNVALKTTLMHNGRFTNLTQVVAFYRLGGGTAGPRDPLLQPLNLTQTEIQQLLDFLANGLVDPRVQQQLPPFDRPTLWSERVAVGANEFGSATAGSTGVPAILAHIPPTLGQAEFALGLAAGPAGAPAWFGLSLLPAPPGTVLHGVALAIDFGSVLALPVVLGIQGCATRALPVPTLPGLLGLRLYAQAFVADPAAPTGWAATRGARLDVR